MKKAASQVLRAWTPINPFPLHGPLKMFYGQSCYFEILNELLKIVLYMNSLWDSQHRTESLP
jgi:hypothetical protein